MTDDELAEALSTAPPGPPRTNARILADLWAENRLEGEPPIVEPVRTVSVNEWNDLYPGCMADLGFPSTTDQHGQQGIEVEAAHWDDMQRATYTCLAMYPMDETRMQE